jgi:hypothetical protein
MPYVADMRLCGRGSVPNSASIQGNPPAKFEWYATGSSAWCQRWNSGVDTNHRKGPNFQGTLAWMKIGCSVDIAVNAPKVARVKPNAMIGKME